MKRSKSLRLYSFLITAGPTHEYIDPVRFISNASSGNMGFSIAREAKKRGAKVTVISGPVSKQCYKHAGAIRIIRVVTARQMLERVKKYAPFSDVFISAAAVSDWKPAKYQNSKIHRNKPFNLRLVQNPDILLWVVRQRAKRKNPVIVGFALESEKVEQRAKEKMKEKGVDIMIGNPVSNIGKDSGKAIIFTKQGDAVKCTRISRSTKKEVLSRIILDEITKLLTTT